MELFGCISVWSSSLGVHSRAAFWMRPLGFVSSVLPAFLWWPTGGAKPTSEPQGTGTFCLQTWLGEQLAGALSPQDRQGLDLVDNGAASRLRGAGLPQYPPARRSCKREK